MLTDLLWRQETALLVALASLTVVLYTRSRSKQGKQLPGPSGIPYFGNILQFSALRPAPQFREWALKYGPIFRLKLGPQNMIVLNSAEAADELLNNRSNIFSGRTPPHVAQDLVSTGQRLVFLPYCEEWKVARRGLQRILGPQPARKLRPFQELESHVLLQHLINYGAGPVRDAPIHGDHAPEDHWFWVFRRYAVSLMMYATYGMRADTLVHENNPRMPKIYRALENFAQVAQPGNYLADAFPSMRWLPDILAPWRAEGKRMHATEFELWGGLLDDIKKDMRNGVARESFVGDYLSNVRNEVLDAPGMGLGPNGTMNDMFLAYTAASALEAGSDTIPSTMHSFILFMLSHPHVLEKAREEIDRVVGPDRMPGWDDMENLPYVNACITETLRRRPATIMGVPHESEADSHYDGYFIPKGTTVIGNLWAIHMDPKRFVNPQAFMPERFLPEHRKTHGIRADERSHYAFGWGRRVCVGSHIAESSLYMVCSRVLWGLDFESTDRAVPDINDEERTWTTGFVSIPKPFEVTWRVRSEAKRAIMQKAFEATQSEWDLLNLSRDVI